MTGLRPDPQQVQTTISDTLAALNSKTIAVGLYDLPGSGKTFLLNQLKQELGLKQFAFYEGSEMTARVVRGGLHVFQVLDEKQKVHWRQHPIDVIEKKCANSGKAGVRTGHFLFWSEDQEVGQPVYTQNDLETYTHILYLDFPAKAFQQRRLGDTKTRRSIGVSCPSTQAAADGDITAARLRKWQRTEISQLPRSLLPSWYFVLARVVADIGKSFKTSTRLSVL
jgi:hypothetical protein